MPAEYPHSRYETWRTHFSPDSKPWTDLTISETAHWVNVIEKEHNRRIGEQTDLAMARAPVQIGAALLLLSGLWLAYYLSVTT